MRQITLGRKTCASMADKRPTKGVQMRLGTVFA